MCASEQPLFAHEVFHWDSPFAIYPRVLFAAGAGAKMGGEQNGLWAAKVLRALLTTLGERILRACTHDDRLFASAVSFFTNMSWLADLL